MRQFDVGELTRGWRCRVGLLLFFGSSGRCADCGASGARAVFDVAIEAGFSAGGPVGALVVIDPGPCAHEAEEDVPRGADDNAGVAVPHDQIAGLRVTDALKALDSVVQIVGARVFIGEAGAFVDRVNQMRAVVSRITADFRIERGRDDGETVIGSQSAAGASCVIRSRGLARGRSLVLRGLRRGLLCRTDAQG